jgi:hypothetical protein
MKYKHFFQCFSDFGDGNVLDIHVLIHVLTLKMSKLEQQIKKKTKKKLK